MDRSRLVAWLRIALPLAALAVLSTLFMWGQPAGQLSLPTRPMSAEELAAQPAISGARYATRTPSGAMVSLSANEAVTPAEGAQARQIRLDWAAEDAPALRLDAPQATLQDGRIGLAGGVRLETADGWRLDSARLEADPEADTLIAPDGVKITAPMGQLSAARAEIRRDSGTPFLDLSGDVRLVYDPSADTPPGGASDSPAPSP